MNSAKLQASPFLFLWLLAGITALVLCLLQIAETRLRAIRQQQADEILLTEILATVPHDNDLLNDAFMLDPAAGTLVRTDLLGLTAARPAYIARQQDRITAFVLPVETLAGYNGSIRLLMGVTVESEITGVRVVAHNETPGLGGQIELAFSDWVLSFNNRSLRNTDPLLWRVKKDGGEFDQFAGATITPRAVVGAVRNALEFFAANRDALLTVASTGVPISATQGQSIASAVITAWLVAMMQPLPLFMLGLLLAVKTFFSRRSNPPPPPADIAPGSKRARVTGKS